MWDAITRPEFTARYFHGSRIAIDAQRRVSLAPDGSVRGDSPVTEYDPPRRLVHEWLSLYDPDMAAEEPSRVTWEIEPHEGGYCKLTLTTTGSTVRRRPRRASPGRAGCSCSVD